jgi:hypothetical protein
MYIVLQKCGNFLLSSSALIMEFPWNIWAFYTVPDHFALYPRRWLSLDFMLKVLCFDGRKCTSNTHLQSEKWLSEKKRKCSFSAAVYYSTF